MKFGVFFEKLGFGRGEVFQRDGIMRRIIGHVLELSWKRGHCLLTMEDEREKKKENIEPLFLPGKNNC